MGFRCQTISRNTLANANATRPWQIYADFALHLIGLARPLYAKAPFGLEFDAAVYAFDASTIDLCLSVFAWATFRSTKAAIQLHTLLEPGGVLFDRSGLSAPELLSRRVPSSGAHTAREAAQRLGATGRT